MVRIGTVVVIENQIALGVDNCSRILAMVASTWVEVVVAVASTQVATIGTQAAADTLAAVNTLATVGTLAIASQELATSQALVIASQVLVIASQALVAASQVIVVASQALVAASQVLVVARGISDLAQVEEARKLTAEYRVVHQTSEGGKVVQARICSNQSSNLDMLVTSMKDHPKNLVRTMVQKFFRPKLPSAACIRLKSTDIELMAAYIGLKPIDIELMVAYIGLKPIDIELMAATIGLKPIDIELMAATIEAAQVIIMQAIRQMESMFA